MSLDDVNVSNAQKGIGTPVESRKTNNSGGRDGVEGEMSELFKLNQVLYRLPPSLSLVTKRTLLKQQFQQNSYPNAPDRTIQCIFNTGEYYVAPRSSFLVITGGYNPALVHPTNGTEDRKIYAHLGQGNATALFEEITLTSASGTEICREQNKGLLNTHWLRNSVSNNYIKSAGRIQGFSENSVLDTFDGSGATYNVSINTQSIQGSANVNSSVELNNHGPQTFVIPLTQILGCFNPFMSTLIPAGVLAGSNFMLRLKDPIESLIWTGPGLSGVNTPATPFSPDYRSMVVSDIYFMLDAFQLNDSVLKKLNQVSAGEDGLSVLFDTWDYTLTSNIQVGSVEAQVQQARSRISRSFCVVRDMLQVTNPYCNSLASEPIVANDSTYGTFTNTNYGDLGYTYTYGGTGVYYPNPTLRALTTADKYQVRPNADGGSTYQTGRKFIKSVPNSATLKISNYQAQLGALFFPQQPVQSAAEYVMNHYYVWCRNMTDEHETTALTYQELIGADGSVWNKATTPQTYRLPSDNTVYGAYGSLATADSAQGYKTFMENYGGMTFGMLAERSSLLQLSGLPISNARLLRHKFTVATATVSGSPRQIDCFTQYTRVMKVFLGGRIVLRE